MRPRFDHAQWGPAQLSEAQWRRYAAWERNRDQQWRMPAMARLWIPVVLSLLVQVPASIWVLTPIAARITPDMVVAPVARLDGARPCRIVGCVLAAAGAALPGSGRRVRVRPLRQQRMC